MLVLGRVQNGVVVLDSKSVFPEGAVVTVSYGEPAKQITGAGRIEIPLVKTGSPGSVNLSGDQIAQILDQQDAAS
ncbi:MAG TPA: hypothetical protein VH107_03640 [Lacipirellulaceae bacterium]|nr:hypothetical protein [Lacipirellulaceae bacterium]